MVETTKTHNSCSVSKIIQPFVHLCPLCSFGMAYDFIDCVGDDVDVVSDSEVCVAF